MSADQYIEAVSAPSRDRFGRKKAVAKQYVELSDTSDEEPDVAGVDENNGADGSIVPELGVGENAPGQGVPNVTAAGEEMDVEPKV